MMRKSFYTLWKGKEDNPDDAVLLENESFYFFQRRAFKRAERLADNLIKNWGYVIFVRHITIGNDMCQEWVFTAK